MNQFVTDHPLATFGAFVLVFLALCVIENVGKAFANRK